MFLEVYQALYIEDYKIEIKFNNGESYLVDFENELKGSVFTPLKDKSKFRKFSIPFNTLEWENGADFAPEYLYEIAKLQNQFASEPSNEYGIN